MMAVPSVNVVVELVSTFMGPEYRMTSVSGQASCEKYHTKVPSPESTVARSVMVATRDSVGPGQVVGSGPLLLDVHFVRCLH
jgi:hypothetical protein